jgi:hypothetical protein
MKYASTRIVNGYEVVRVTLPLTTVPAWNPTAPLPNTYLVPDEVQAGWVRHADGSFTAPDPGPAIRAERDRLLIASDKEMLVDLWSIKTTEQQAAWTVYRQALRDVPEQSGFPTNVTWPVAPVSN